MSDGHDFMKYRAIDVHAHCGSYPYYPEHYKPFFDTTAEEVSQRARSCAIDITVLSEIGAFSAPVDQPDIVDAANARAVDGVEQNENLRFYAVANPKSDHWEDRTDRFLEHPRCVGVKLHPRWDEWDVDEHGERLFGYLNERNALTMTHTGHPGNEPERFVPWANKFPNVKLILAHIGNDETDDQRDRQIKALEIATQGNVWADTSSRISIWPRLIELAVDQVGAERILFGTDSPLYYTAMQKARIAYAQISDDDKRKILCENAAELLGVTG